MRGLTAEKIRAKAPKIIIVTIVVAVIAVILIQLLEDIFLSGQPTTPGPVGLAINALIQLTRNVTSTIASWGYIGVFVLMLLESSSLPIPSEVILPFAGYLVSQGRLDFWLTVAAATLAGIGGSLVDYYIGLKGAHALSQHRILGKAFFTKSQLDTAANWFNKYGGRIVFLSRLVPGFRTIVSFPAGAIKMPLGKFLILTAAGCLVWNSILIYLGVFLGQNWRAVAGFSHYLIIAAAVALVAAALVFFLRRRKRNAAHNKIT